MKFVVKNNDAYYVCDDGYCEGAPMWGSCGPRSTAGQILARKFLSRVEAKDVAERVRKFAEPSAHVRVVRLRPRKRAPTADGTTTR